jgi:hypothetical protein
LNDEMANGWTASWIMWLIMFGAIELPALLNKSKGDTLSEHVWRFFSIREKSNGWRARRFVLLSFLAWLITHFLSGGKFV